ncbi:MAG: DUF2070 family protein [Candidatus Micrarchaeota archaeon]
MTVDQREKAISASRVLFKIPPYRKVLLYLIAFTFFAGFLIKLYAGNSPAASLVYGGAEGFLLLALPALLAGGISSFYSKQPFKYYAFLGLASAVLAAVVYFIAMASGQVLTGIIVANALVVLLWFITSFITLNQGAKSLALSLLQPFFNIAFLWFWERFGFFESTLPLGSPVIAFLKILVSGGILLLGLWVVFYVINAPAKRNFGVSTVQAVALFFAQWTSGKKEFEQVLAEMGEAVETNIEGIVFANPRGKLKAIFLSPQVHFGPFGNLGGSEFPFLLGEKISSGAKTPCFVFHSTVNHDFNPIYSASHSLIAKTVLEEVKNSRRKSFAKTACFIQGKSGSAGVAGFAFGQNAFLSLSRAPEGTEDIELSMGLALRNAALRNFSQAVVVDRHNSITDGGIFRVGSREYFEFENAVSQISPAVGRKFKMGVDENKLEGFSVENGIAKAGLKTAVFEMGGRKYAIVLIDGNNITPSFRAKALLALKGFGFAWADVFSTDSHSVNRLGGVHNPVGKNLDQEKLAGEIRKSVGRASENLEECGARFYSRRISISVLGGRKQSELISTINSIVAIARILAPAILILSVILVIALLASSA